MRKPLILFVSFILLLCFSTTAPAQEENRKISTREEAISHAVQLFPEIIRGKENLLHVDFSSDQHFGGHTWTVTYSRSEPLPYRLSISFSAETGQLVNFHYIPDKYPGDTRVLSRDEAKKIADDFIKKHHPDKTGKIAEQEIDPAAYYDGSINLIYYFSWHQLVDGKQFDANTLSVGVNAISEQVVHFYCQWMDNVDIPQHPVMDRDTFTSQVVNKLGLYPCYIINPGSPTPGARLIYRLNSAYNAFDAASGNPLDYEGKEISIEEARLFTQQLTPVPASKTKPDRQPKQGTIAPDKLPQIAESFFKKLGIEGAVRRSGSGHSSGPGYSMEYWYYSVEQNNSSRISGEISVGIDTSTGDMVDYRNRQAESRGATGEGITRDKALAAATAFLSKASPENTENMLLRNIPAFHGKEPAYSFSWVRLVNGVPLMDDMVHIIVDRYTGEVTEYHKTQRAVSSFPGTRDIISPDQALQAFLKAQPFALVYNSYQSDSNENTGNVRLVYADIQNLAVDARTGEIIRTYGDNPDLIAYDKIIAGHQARLPLALLARSGLLPEPEVFDPNGSVTRREGLRVLVAIPSDYRYNSTATVSPFSDVTDNDGDLEVILKAVHYNIVEAGGKLRPGAILTREDLAVWLVNMLGHREVAEAQDLNIVLDYQDAAQIGSGKKNYVAIAAGLNLMDADAGGNFRPQDPVTWGELAGVAVRIAPRLAR
ncbi:YcdB/YcdC domain-containing protein [Desulfallas thermosapovorans]|uniref:Peptidase YpeB-like protein n=1 Tax=Desulfallas thermosapovorans DSM 6562 TaxID=1121431 RepID=A0A5S4ZR81_9FIRM|nr:YcdB/YcdC domain-containing protein [Desulfallas thermosapovorans]TYO95334.1 peptidase YpeB-like protein [Desulfallas thermosapovorans DSM 6562]